MTSRNIARCALGVLLVSLTISCGSKDPVAPGDNTPPAAVSNLRVFSTTATSATLRWTAPGNDGMSGTAALYDVRYSTDPLSDDNWAGATPVADVPPPQVAGSLETLVVSGLSNLETYYFGLKTRDNNSNWSPLSNVFSTADPRTFYVCPDGSGDFDNIQDGIFQASDGDTVTLCDGTYTGTGNRDISYHGKAITVKSTSGNPAACVIDCEGLTRGFTFDSLEDTTSVLEGVTVTNGSSTRGGAVFCGFRSSSDGAAPKFVNCVFSNSTASTAGGGVFCDYRGSGAVLINCTFSGNSGSGLHLSEDADVTVTDCTFDGNAPYGLNAPRYSNAVVTDTRFTNHADRAVRVSESTVSLAGCTFDGNPGGGLVCRMAHVTLENCTFSNNSAENGGGILTDYDGTFTVTNCTFTGNSATTSGGAICCDNFYGLNLDNCTFTGNSAATGGAVYCDGYYSSPYFPASNCTFFNNTASTGGGAVYLGVDATYGYYTNCTFAENSAPSGSGVYVSNYAEIRMWKCIVVFGKQGAAVTCSGTGAATFTCSDVYGNEGGDWSGCIYGQGGTNNNISFDPEFCGEPGSGILTLQSDSPCATVSCGPIGSFPVGCAP
jgi:predicted outer membrane repeat protein